MLLTLKTNPLGKLNIMPTVIPYYLPPLPCYKLGNGGKADMQKKIILKLSNTPPDT